MLENMRKVLERMDEISNQFRGMSPRHARREKQNFNSVLNEIQKNQSPTPDPRKDERPIPSGLLSETGLRKTQLPLPAPSPAVNEGSDYSDLISTYAAKNNLDPKLVKQIISAESGFDPNSVSRKGAMGLMQLMPETARELGVTNPFDPEGNIEGGTRYLAKLLKENGGDVSRALASFNAGPGAVRRHGGIPPYQETRHFVQRVLNGMKNDPEPSEE